MQDMDPYGGVFEILKTHTNSKKKNFKINPNLWSDPSMEKHDLYNFEAKIDYPLQKDQKENNFSLDAYFFIPSQLQINQSSYGKAKFFADLNTYTRFRTPKMALYGIMNNDNKLSPITKIRKFLQSIKNGEDDSEPVKNIIYELRVLGCIIKANLRDQFHLIYSSLSDLDECSEFCIQVSAYLDSIKELQKTIFSLSKDFLLTQIPSEAQEAFHFVEDYISLQILDRLTVAYRIFQDREEVSSLIPHIQNIIETEQAHRKNLNSQLKLVKDAPNESYSYWESILKKFVQSVLYLDINPENEKSKLQQIFYSFAAGLAMFASLYLGLAISRNFEENSTGFILALVLAYMLKDRIKDNIKFLSDRAVGIVFPDRKVAIFDGDHEKKIGVSKETMYFINRNEIPHEILSIREASNKSIIENQGKPETIFRYKKRITLFTDVIESIHTRHGDINDILRFNVRNFIQYADDPVQKINVWNKQTQKNGETPC